MSTYPHICGFCGTPYRGGGEGSTHYPVTPLTEDLRELWLAARATLILSDSGYRELQAAVEKCRPLFERSEGL